ncbi:hypothetical protein MAHJHV58_46820 [Mycobacterium avium subsp. hominissuis]|uniref:hypothetical protein n=1 Tax=Mycobacterium avium TaxID=1764 RepID=UPI000BAF96F8|nr:hypothetical protein [Mycobacterium avium]PBA38813.1 hypothetical protein CKJ63_25460 [Mycobacterium avium]PBA78724.1 hypothetical protein CKJ72_25500 [Mycobacterium avium]
MTTSDTLAHARADIHASVAAHDDPHRRRQYALAARDHAAEVLLAADATPSELEHARHYFADAAGILTA